MKTIIGAVNEMKADLINLDSVKFDDTYICNVNYSDDCGWWCSRGSYGSFVCTVEVFNKSVNDCSLNFGKTSHEQVGDYFNADKELLTPPIELIDGKAYQFDFKEQKYLVGICHTYMKYGTKNVMFGSPVRDAKWNTEYCTNIQPLTIGDK